MTGTTDPAERHTLCLRRCVLSVAVLAVLLWPAVAAATDLDPWRRTDYPHIFFATRGVQVHYNPWVCDDTDGCVWNHAASSDPANTPEDLFSAVPVWPQPWHPVTYTTVVPVVNYDFTLVWFPRGTVLVSACYTGETVNADCGHHPAPGWIFGDPGGGLPDWIPAAEQARIRAIHTTHTVVFAVCLSHGDEGEQTLQDIRDTAEDQGLLRPTHGTLHGWGNDPSWPNTSQNGEDGRAWDLTGRNWTTDIYDPQIAWYDKDMMGPTLNVGFHGDEFFTDDTQNSKTLPAADDDRNCTRSTCPDTDRDGDGDPTNDPPLPFDPDNLGPNPADHCVCVEAAKTNRIKYLQDGTVNWLGWELVSPGTANDWPIWQRIKDPGTDTGWAEDADGNPMCGRPH